MEIITDNGIKNLTNITKLDLCFNEIITDNGIKNLIKYYKIKFMYITKL